MAADAPAPLAARRRFLSRSADASRALGERLGEHLPPGTVVALHGELGSGKTTLVQGIARGLGVREPVTSPTFTLQHQYEGRVSVHHLDAWMQARGEAFLLDGGAEWLHGRGVALVEWAERVGAWLPLPRLAVRLEHRGPHERQMIVEVLGTAGPSTAALEALLQDLQPPAGVEEAP